MTFPFIAVTNDAIEDRVVVLAFSDGLLLIARADGQITTCLPDDLHLESWFVPSGWPDIWTGS